MKWLVIVPGYAKSNTVPSLAFLDTLIRQEIWVRKAADGLYRPLCDLDRYQFSRSIRKRTAMVMTAAATPAQSQ
jgi:hypothetical protein